MFAAAKSPTIIGGTFTTVEGGLHVHDNEQKGIERLHEQIAAGAFYNSLERRPPPNCHPETRKVVLQEIMDWVRDDDRSPFLWVSGLAGSGKSSIAQTIAEICDEEGMLAAGFFFSRVAEGRNNDSRFIATLAYQLTISIRETHPLVGSALDRDAFLFSRSLQAQMGSLIVDPIRKSSIHENVGGPRLVIIDGLDECSQPGGQNDILNVFSLAVQRFSCPLYFLITSRPEYDIRDAFDENPLNSLTRRIVLDEKYDPNADIKTFLQSRFEEIKKRHPLKSVLPSSWPEESILDELTRRSSGLFIYASTVMKFIQSPIYRPTERLDIVLGLSPPSLGRDAPFTDLDALYMHVFEAVDNIEPALQAFSFLLFTQSRLINTSDLVEDFLFLRRGDLQLVLGNLHSIIDLPPPERLHRPELRVFQALGDFLTDASRSGKFYISPGEAHNGLARYCIKHMSPTPTFSMLSHHLVSYIGLMQHCLKADPTEDLLQDLYKFDFEKFLDLPLQGDFPRALVQIDDFLSMLPSFLHWLRGQFYPDNSNGLYKRYLCHLDNHIKRRLSYYRHDLSSLHLFAASTLTKFPEYTRVIWHILVPNNHQPEGSVIALQTVDCRQAGLRLTSEERLLESWNGYYTMLTDFFNDRNRAGIYHVESSNYLFLIKIFVEFLTQTHKLHLTDTSVSNEIQQEAEECSLYLLADCLWRVPVDRRLGVYLLETMDRVARNVGETDAKGVAILAMQEYIEECENQVGVDGCYGSLVPWLSRKSSERRNWPRLGLSTPTWNRPRLDATMAVQPRKDGLSSSRPKIATLVNTIKRVARTMSAGK